MSNLDTAERDKFSALAEQWWDPQGPNRTLHEINPCRLAYVQASRSLAGANVADIGCGGGLLSAAMARAGAHVTAIDASEALIGVATAQAERDGLQIDYRAQLSADLAAQAPGSFDLVTCMELLEHVPDPAAVIADCARLLNANGILIVATLNRTPAAYVTAILGAEYALGLLPRGTHDYQAFIRPAELVAGAREQGLRVSDISGMRYNPLTRSASLSRSVAVNYMARFVAAPA